MTRSRLTTDQLAEIHRLGDKGWKSGRIARHLALNQSAVNYQMLRAGIDPFAHPGKRQNHPGTFSQAEDARLLELRNAGMAVTAIGREIGRAYTSVRLRLLLIEVRAEKALEAA